MATAKKTAEVVPVDTKSDIRDWDSALAYFRANGIELRRQEGLNEVLGDGFAFLTDKSTLINRPFAIVDYKTGFSSNWNTPMASVWGITQDGYRFKFVDMSTGVADQLANAVAKGVSPIGFFFTGLTKSEYDKELETGETVHGVTFYLPVG